METDDKIQRIEPGARALEARPARPLVTPYETIQVEETPDLLAYWRILVKRRWTVLTIFFVLFATVLIGTLKQTPIYSAMALLEIQQENPSLISVQELFKLDSVSDTYLETQFRILKSETLARRVIAELGLEKLEEFVPRRSWFSYRRARKPKSPEETGSFVVGQALAFPDAEVDQRVMEKFQDRLTVVPVKDSRLVQVYFASEDSEIAARVVNTLAANFIERNLEARWEASQKASEWLTTQLVGLKSRLEKSEEELQKYARENGLLFLDSAAGVSENIFNERLRQIQEELTRAQATRFEREGLYRLIEASDPASLPGVLDNKLTQDLTLQLAEIRRQHAEISTTFTPDYPRVKQLQNQIDEIEAVLARERERAANRLANDYRAALQRENLLRQAFEDQKRQADLIAERSVQYNILKREVDTNKNLYDGLLQRLKEAGVSAGLKASNISIVDSAKPPEKPAKPRVLLNLALAVILGLGLGVGAAFFQEYLDNTLKTSEDVERFLQVPALALVPSVESLNGRRGGVYGLYERGKLLSQGGSAHPQALARPAPRWFRIDQPGQEHSVLSEAFRSLRTSVLLSAAEHPPRALLISSSQPGEGKTTISANLALSLAQLGQRVLLIDGDLRRPAVHRVFGVRTTTGVVGYLTGQQEWRAAVQPAATSLDVLVCGPVPPNPAELLSSEPMKRLVREAMNEYDFVIIDSAPLLNVADSRVLASLTEGIVLVVKGGSTPRDLVQRAQTCARDVGGHIIGVVLNNLDLREDAYYYYRNYRYDAYGPRDESSD